MEISEVRVKLVSNSKERLRAFCSITIESEFVIRDLKIIDGLNGTFVAMPSRKLADRCPKCGYKNHLRAHFCNECGKELGEQRGKRATKRGKLHADIAHPINAGCRERIQNIVIGAFEEELEKSRQPGYRPPEFDFGDDSHDDEMQTEHAVREEPTRRQEPAPEPQREADRAPANEREEDGGGYDQMIAELKNDAKERRQKRDASHRSFDPAPEEVTAPAEEPCKSESLAPATSGSPDDSVGFGPPPGEVTPPAKEPCESESLAPAASGSPDDSVGFGPPPEEVTPPAKEPRESEPLAPAASGGTGGSGTQTKSKPSDEGFGAGLL